MTPQEIFESLTDAPITEQELKDAYNTEYPENDSSRFFTPDSIAIWIATADAILKRANEPSETERLGGMAADMASALIAGMIIINNRKCCGACHKDGSI